MVVQPILTEEQALLVHQALIALLNTPPGELSTSPDEETSVKQQLSELVYFFSTVVEHPEKFQLRSPEDNQRIIRAAKRAAKGPAQPQSRRNRRKARQAERTRTAKARRKEAKYMAEEHNRALRIFEAEQKEAEEAYEAERERIIDRFESIAGKETIRAEELQEVLELFGSPEAAERARELRANNDPQRRLAAAQERATSEGAGVDGA